MMKTFFPAIYIWNGFAYHKQNHWSMKRTKVKNEWRNKKLQKKEWKKDDEYFVATHLLDTCNISPSIFVILFVDVHSFRFKIIFLQKHCYVQNVCTAIGKYSRLVVAILRYHQLKDSLLQCTDAFLSMVKKRLICNHFILNHFFSFFSFGEFRSLFHNGTQFLLNSTW